MSKRWCSRGWDGGAKWGGGIEKRGRGGYEGREGDGEEGEDGGEERGGGDWEGDKEEWGEGLWQFRLHCIIWMKHREITICSKPVYTSFAPVYNNNHSMRQSILVTSQYHISILPDNDIINAATFYCTQDKEILYAMNYTYTQCKRSYFNWLMLKR